MGIVSKSIAQELSYSNLAKIYQGDKLTGIDFPVGPLGGSVIRMNGKAERQWWQIFNNYEEREGSGIVPNSFFAIRASANGSTVVRALQTSSVGSFLAMNSLSFQGEFPFGWYNFHDDSLHIDVKMEVFNPLIPMDLKNSAIPCSIYKINVKNTSNYSTSISLLGSQQNAVGFDGYGIIDGDNNRSNSGYGSNVNTIDSDVSSTSLNMKGTIGSMQLSAFETEMTYTASFDSISSLFNDFSRDGSLFGPSTASSPSNGVTVDGALVKEFSLAPGEEKTVTFVLSWYILGAKSGLQGNPAWSFEGQQYENWWTDASDVFDYVKENYKLLETKTKLFHDTLYNSNIPRYAIDRLSSNLCVLKSPTAFWAKNGYFGLWESTSNNEQWYGNCKHVYHYAQSISAIYPELSRKLMEQNLASQNDDGLLPARDGDCLNALDGHLGTILGIYRDYRKTNDKIWLESVWPKTLKAMEYIITEYDSNVDGMFTGIYNNTLDCVSTGTNSFIGTMYLAALKASSAMAELMGQTNYKTYFDEIYQTGVRNQNQELWDEKLNYYVEKSENLSDTKSFGNGSVIDMLLGQWWSNQVDLGQIYPEDRTKIALSQIYKNNRFTDPGGPQYSDFRDFLGTGDTGWMMNKFPAQKPENPVLYYDEVMSGFEYSLAATLIQYGMIDEGMDIVKCISDRYDGRLRGADEVNMASQATVYGTGSPFGEDECGDFYGRAMSSWSILLALQGYIYNGPEKVIGFKPVWKPEAHKSFFTTSDSWGLFSQIQTETDQNVEMIIKYGCVELNKIILRIPIEKNIKNVVVNFNGISISIESIRQITQDVEIVLNNNLVINEDSMITFKMTYDD